MTQWSPLYLTSSPRLKPGDSQGRTPVYKKIGSNVTVLLRRHATLIHKALRRKRKRYFPKERSTEPAEPGVSAVLLWTEG